MQPAKWGKPYGMPFCTRHGRVRRMFRKGQRVRFYDGQGRQIGPEQRNVAPAVAYALSKGWDTCHR
ncbi:hypothetical protein LCGC14_1222580 [marine sediment metagenome]|uniref:Uncharacterized protein n=1 Tax=marine sediment metagenome TaxID=412755 RepID=A0A0F9LAX3_9ZZZZ